MIAVLDLKPLKRWAQRELAYNSVLLAILLQEPDTMHTTTFLPKMDTWLKLIQHESKQPRQPI